MPRGVRLTPEQVETVKRVWLETSNASEAARQAGCSHQSVLRTIVRQGLDSSGQLYAHALAKAEVEHLAFVNRARSRLAAALDAAEDGAVPEIVRAANDSLRAVSQTRAAHLKVTGLAAPEKHEHAVAAEVVVLPALESHGSPAPQGAVAAEPGAAD